MGAIAIAPPSVVHCLGVPTGIFVERIGCDVNAPSSFGTAFGQAQMQPRAATPSEGLRAGPRLRIVTNFLMARCSMRLKQTSLLFVLGGLITACGGGDGSGNSNSGTGARIALQAPAEKMAALDGMFLNGNYADYTISKTASGYVVKANATGAETAIAAGVKRLKFDDQFVGLDIDGTAGQVYRLYQAAFDRRPDLDGLGYQIAAVEQSGLSLGQVSQNFIDSPEFAARYGSMSTTQFVTALYANVLHRAPDAEGLAFHVGNIESGKLARAQVLMGFSESPENQGQVLSAIQGGIVFRPWLSSVAGTSYNNFKAIGLVPQVLPHPGPDSLARAYADFSGRGVIDLFTATGTYSPTKPISQATPSKFEFWRKQADGTYSLASSMLASSAGCIHPRKAIVADFNNDGRPDIFVACHGYDAAPFPGERSKIVLSRPDGTYVTQDASSDVGFFHGAAAADLNGDGLVDVVVVNNFDPDSAFVLINQGGGSFKREIAKRLPASIGWKPYFSVELVDIDEDGKLDLVLGGHEFSDAPTAVFINPGNNNFSGVVPIVVPAVTGEGVVLDFTVTGSGASRALWVARSSGGDGTFYQSRTVQKVQWPSLASSVVLRQRPAQWFPWLIPTVVNGQQLITTDNAADGISIAR